MRLIRLASLVHEVNPVHIARTSRIVVVSERIQLRCERTTVRILPRAVVFTTTAAAIYSFGYGLRIFTAEPRSTQPCIPASVRGR